MVTLYRKYRSRNFEELVGQEHVVSIIKQAVREGRLAHAYLFTGPRGTGKTSLARILAKAINCTAPFNGEPCDECGNCKAINLGSYMDLIEIDAASNRGIDEIRSLKETISFMPVQGKHKVYIIDEVHMLTEPAFNALLKTLEEPPQQVLFILATTEPHKLPLTIISRTQRFDFKLANDEVLQGQLAKIIAAEGFSIDPEALELVIRAGQGSFRDAETVLEKVLTSVSVKGKTNKISREETEQILGYVNSAVVREFIDALEASDRNKALKVLNNVYARGFNLVQFVREALEAARARMVESINKGSKDLRVWLGIIKELNQAGQEMRSSLINVLPIEIAIINITSSGSDQPVIKPSASQPPVTFEDKKNETVKAMAAPKEQKRTKSATPAVRVDPQVNVSQPEKEVENVSVGTAFVETEGLPTGEAVEKLNNSWQEVLKEAKKYNHFLTAILTNSKFDLDAEGQAVLKVSSTFHKKQLDNMETRKILNKITASFCGGSVQFTCIIDAGLKAQNAKSSNAKLVEDLLL
jgi:DNA polymerase III subunit gamma/tau